MQTMAVILTLIGLAAAGVAWGASDPDLRGWGAVLGAAFLVAASGAWPAWLLAQARQDAARIRAIAAPTTKWGDDNLPAPDPEHALRHSAGWQQSVAVVVPATLALLLMAWIRPAGGGANQELVPAIVALVLLFPLVVVERLVADLATAFLPERDGLVRILRVPVAACGVAGLSLLASSMGWQSAWYAQWPVAVLIAAVAVELLGRAVIHLWLPATEPRSCADSVVAGAILARINPITAVVEGLRDRFGVDLSRSWSAQVVAAAFPWVALSMLLVGWLLSGVSVVTLGKRVVLEGHGEARVLGAGTHLHLPWPFAVRRTIEDGRIRETILGDLDKPLTPIDAQAIPPAAYDRLWDVAHPAESTFLVPATATAGTGQGFRVVSSDVRVHWRIGSSDADAIAAVGRLNDADALIGQAARRALTATFSTRPLEGLIAADRDGLGASLRLQVQSELDRLAGGRSGLLVAAVVIDAIHPPTGAAAAYHRVQSAEIEARAQVSRGRAEALRITSLAAVEAMDRRAAATATAVESTTKATADATRFAADQTAWTANREAMATERWLGAIRSGMSKKPVTVFDHRLDLRDVPVLDLRPISPELRP
jgi:regulator of protease activity HflC (stomatin/prohibitin superfamily)